VAQAILNIPWIGKAVPHKACICVEEELLASQQHEEHNPQAPDVHCLVIAPLLAVRPVRASPMLHHHLRCAVKVRASHFRDFVVRQATPSETEVNHLHVPIASRDHEVVQLDVTVYDAKRMTPHDRLQAVANDH